MIGPTDAALRPRKPPRDSRPSCTMIMAPGSRGADGAGHEGLDRRLEHLQRVHERAGDDLRTGAGDAPEHPGPVAEPRGAVEPGGHPGDLRQRQPTEGDLGPLVERRADSC